MGCSLRLQRFCCCCTLRTGSLVIGTLGWLVNLLQIIFAPTSSVSANKNQDFDKNVSKGTMITRIVLGLVYLLICVLLIVGVYKKNNKYMLPWLILQMLGIVVLTIGGLVLFGFTFVVEHQFVLLCVIMLIVIIVLIALDTYCWLCVWSHYMDLKEEEGTVSTTNVQYHTPAYVQTPPEYTKGGVPLA